MQKHNILQVVGMRKVKKHNSKKPTPELLAWHKEFKRNEALIESLGYREMPPDKYEQWLKSMEQEKAKQLSNQSLTSVK